MTLCILCCEEVYKMGKGKEVRQAESEPDVQEISSTCQKVLDR